MKAFIIAAITADGFIGRSNSHQADWTGKADKKVFINLTKEAGIMIMGSRTFATIGRALPDRRNIIYTNNPETITASDVETTSEDPATLLARLEKEGANAVAICGGASIYDLFMREKLVDELYLTVVPVIFGRGLQLFTSELAADLLLLDTESLEGGAVLLHYKITK